MAAAWATRLLDVPGPEPVRRVLLVAVAELHSEAGWSAFDAGLYRRALYHYARTLELATEAGDAYLQALALRYAGLASVEHGHPNDGLKMLQCAQARAWDIPLDDQRAVVVGVSGRAAAEACALQESATALACLGEFDNAVAPLEKGRHLWTPSAPTPSAIWIARPRGWSWRRNWPGWPGRWPQPGRDAGPPVRRPPELQAV